MSELISIENCVEPNGRILIVDDNRAIHDDYYRILSPGTPEDTELDELDRELFGGPQRAQRHGFELRSAFQGEEAIELVRTARQAETPYSVAFVDVRMPPGIDGIETAARLLEDDPDLCVVICSAYSDYDWSEMHRIFGETDRVLMLKKPFDTIEVRQLAHALKRRWELTRIAAFRLEDMRAMLDRRTRELEIANERLREEAAAREDALERLHESNEEIKTLAYTDGLTGLPNRRLLNEHFAKVLARARRKHTEFAVLFLDFDNFKQLNDTIGHEEADAVLRNLATGLADLIRSDDVLALHWDSRPDADTTLGGEAQTDAVLSRLGGDEFALLLPEIKDRYAAGAVARRILEHLKKPIESAAQEAFVTCSIGIALYPADGDSADVLIRNADTAMYHAKQMGKGTYQYFSESMHRAAVERLNVETALKRALDSDQLELHYQPIVALASGEIVAVEALLRWRHPELGDIAPGCFVPVAEESGLILPIGEWALERACRQAREWREAGLPPVAMHVNVAAAQLTRQDFPGVLRAAMAAHALEAGQVRIELTERAVAALGSEAARLLEQIRALGVGVTLDDFGTGHSSLGHLCRLPIDTLKIDLAFTREIPSGATSAALVETLLAMARVLGMHAVVERVETAEQLAQLRRAGCDEAQGFAVGEPAPAAEIAERLAVEPARARA